MRTPRLDLLDDFVLTDGEVIGSGGATHTEAVAAP